METPLERSQPEPSMHRTYLMQLRIKKVGLDRNRMLLRERHYSNSMEQTSMSGGSTLSIPLTGAMMADRIPV